MLKPKYKVGQNIFVVQQYKVVRCRIAEIVIHHTPKEEYLEYIVIPTGLEKAGKVKALPFREAYLVEDFKIAQKSALTNWENIYEKIKEELENLTEKTTDVIPKKPHVK